MSRGFFGGGGGGDSKRPGAAKGDPTRKKSVMNSLNFSRKRNKTMNELVRERTTQIKDYSEMVEDLIDAKMASTERKRAFELPGTAAQEQKPITKGRAAAIEHFKMKRMKQRMKVRDQRVEVIAKNYNGTQGGWIDKKGRIRNKHGQIVMEVNTKNGVITNRLGLKVGKYNPHSMTCDFKIQRLLQRYEQHQHRHDNPFAGKGQHDGPFNPFGGKN